MSCVPAFAAEPDGQITVRARVEEVVSDEMASTSYSGGEITTRVLTLRVRVLEGAFEGQTALIRQVFDEISLPSAYPAKAGDLLFVTLELDEQNLLVGNAADYVRDLPLALLGGGFLLFLILFGRQKGVKTVLSLAVTCLVVFGLFFPLAVRGINPVWLSLLCAALMTGFTLFWSAVLPAKPALPFWAAWADCPSRAFWPRSFPTRCAFPES